MRQTDAVFASYLQNTEIAGTVLLVGLIDRFGTEFFDWEPETLRLEMEHEWGVKPPQRNMDKIWALVTELTTDSFYSTLSGFIQICNALGGDGADFQNFNPATVQEMCWTLAEVQLTDPPDRDSKFSEEVKAYMQARLDAEGFSKPPQMLKNHVKEEPLDESINQALTSDGIDYNAYWDKQARDRLAIDEYVRHRLYETVSAVAALPLESADRKALQDLQRHAATALAIQSKATERESEHVRPAPTL
jgi:hypothetical protein